MYYFFINVSKINTTETAEIETLPLICATINEGDSQPTLRYGTQNEPITEWKELNPDSLEIVNYVIYSLNKQELYALLSDKTTWIFFPWNAEYESFSPGSALDTHGDMKTLLNQNNVPKYRPKGKKSQLTPLEFSIKDKNNFLLNKNVSALNLLNLLLDTWFEKQEEEQKISHTAMILNSNLSAIIHLKDQFCAVLKDISSSNALDVILHYFFQKYSNEDIDEEKEICAFSASILTLLQLGVSPKDIIARQFPLRFLVQNAIQMNVVETAYENLQTLANNASIDDTLKTSIQDYFQVLKNSSRFIFRTSDLYSFYLDGSSVSPSSPSPISSEPVTYLYETILKSPLVVSLNPSLKNKVATLCCIDNVRFLKLSNNNSDAFLNFLRLYPRDNNKLYDFILMNTPDEYLSKNLSTIFFQFDKDYPDVSQKIQARLDILSHTSFVNTEKVDVIMLDLIDRYTLEKIIEAFLNIYLELEKKSSNTTNYLFDYLVGQVNLNNYFSVLPLKDRKEKTTFLHLIAKFKPEKFTELIRILSTSEAIDFEQCIKPLLAIQDEDGNTPWHWFAHTGPAEFATLMGTLVTHKTIDFEQSIKSLLAIQNSRFDDTPLHVLAKIRPAEFATLMGTLLTHKTIDFEQSIKPLLAIQNSCCNTPLHVLAYTGPAEFATLMGILLANETIDFEQSIKSLLAIQNSYFDDTPLHVLAKIRPAEFATLISTLLTNETIDFENRIKPLIEIKNNYGYTPLHWFAKNSPREFPTLISTLLNNERIDFENRIKPLLAIQDEDGDTLWHSLAQDSPAEFATLISALVTNETIDFERCIKPLMEISNSQNNTPWDLFAQNNPAEFATLISALVTNETIDFEQSIKPLLAIKGTSYGYGHTTLHWLAKNSPAEFATLISALVTNETIDFERCIKPLIEIKNSYSYTPLHWLAEGSPAEFATLMSILLTNETIDFENRIKPLIEIKNKYGDTPLHWFAKNSPREFPTLISTLLNNERIDFENRIKPLIEIKDNDGNASWHWLAKNTPTEFARLISALVTHKTIDFEQSIKPLIEIKDNDGNAPWPWLAQNNPAEFATLISALVTNETIDFEQSIKPLLAIKGTSYWYGHTHGHTTLHWLSKNSPAEFVTIISTLLNNKRIDFAKDIEPFLPELDWFAYNSPAEFVTLISTLLNNERIDFAKDIGPLLLKLDWFADKSPAEFTRFISTLLNNERIDFAKDIEPLLPQKDCYRTLVMDLVSIKTNNDNKSFSSIFKNRPPNASESGNVTQENSLEKRTSFGR